MLRASSTKLTVTYTSGSCGFWFTGAVNDGGGPEDACLIRESGLTPDWCKNTDSISCWARYDILEARMPHEKTIGKPDAGNPHVRFERGPQETEPPGHRA